MRKVYIADTESFQEGDFERLYRHMPKERQELIDRMRFRKDKLLALGAGVLSAVALRSYQEGDRTSNATPVRVDFHLVQDDELAETDSLTVERAKFGKPYWKKYPQVFHNLSHSGTKVILAISDQEIGCDVEKNDRDVESIVSRCFSDEEKEAYRKSPTPAETFSMIWTRKESFLKAIGVGLRESLKDFSVMDAEGRPILRQNLSESFWVIDSYNSEPGYCYSICRQKEEDDMNFEKITQYLDSLPAQYGIPSFDCIMMKDHEQVYRHMSGTVDTDRKQAVSADNTYLMFSMTKIQTMTCLMRLVEQGKVSLSDEVAKYLPAYGNLTVREKVDGTERIVPAKTPLLINHLVSMQSGLDYDLERPGILRVLKEYGESATTRQIVDAFVETPLQFHPGEHFLYSLSHDVVAALIEVVTGQSFGTYLKENIWLPLGMKNTHFFKRSVPEPKLAQQYIATEQGIVPMENDCCYQFSEAYESGGAGLVSCTEDYAILADTLACGGTAKNGYVLLKPETIETIRTNLLTEQGRKDIAATMGRVAYGYGCGMQIFMEPELVGSPAKAGVFGWDGAAGSCTIMDRDNQRALVFVIHVRNLGVSYSEIHPRLRDLLFEK